MQSETDVYAAIEEVMKVHNRLADEFLAAQEHRFTSATRIERLSGSLVARCPQSVQHGIRRLTGRSPTTMTTRSGETITILRRPCYGILRPFDAE